MNKYVSPKATAVDFDVVSVLLTSESNDCPWDQCADYDTYGLQKTDGTGGTTAAASTKSPI